MLFWIDIETTGLDPEYDVMLEIGVMVTDDELNVIGSMPDMQIAASPGRLTTMSSVVKTMHETSGLLTDVVTKGRRIEYVSEYVKQFIVKAQPEGPRTLAGSSVHFDRSFLKRHMPAVDGLFSHRHADCSALREFARRWRPDVSEDRLNPARAHRPALDLLDSITLARFYRDSIFNTKE